MGMSGASGRPWCSCCPNIEDDIVDLFGAQVCPILLCRPCSAEGAGGYAAFGIYVVEQVVVVSCW